MIEAISRGEGGVRAPDSFWTDFGPPAHTPRTAEHRIVVDDLEVRTMRHRAERAARLRDEAARRYAEQRRQYVREQRLEAEGRVCWLTPLREPEGVQMSDGRMGATWHATRAAGVRHRYERVRRCAWSPTYLVRSCGCSSSRLRLGCGRIECVDCRRQTVRRRGARFRRTREGLIQATRAARLRVNLAERMLTLTVPHHDVHGRALSVEERLDLLALAWRGDGRHTYAQRLREHARESVGDRRWERVAPFTHTVRVQEWTEGSDGDGHPHFHVWHHGPFLPREEFRRSWTRAIQKAAAMLGISLPAEFQAVVDVRRVDPKTVHKELVKYLLKDLRDGSNHGEWVDGDVLARVLCRTEGLRMMQTSRGFSRFRAAREITWCSECGCQHEHALMLDHRWDHHEGRVISPPPS